MGRCDWVNNKKSLNRIPTNSFPLFFYNDTIEPLQSQIHQHTVTPHTTKPQQYKSTSTVTHTIEPQQSQIHQHTVTHTIESQQSQIHQHTVTLFPSFSSYEDMSKINYNSVCVPKLTKFYIFICCNLYQYLRRPKYSLLTVSLTHKQSFFVTLASSAQLQSEYISLQCVGTFVIV